MNRAFENDSEMLEAYGLYRLCVLRNVHTIDSGDMKITRVYPAGFIQLPYPGSMVEQPHRTMEYFHHFMNGELEAFFRK
jgi:hypothetical protein